MGSNAGIVSKTLSRMSPKMKAVRRIDDLDLRRLHKRRLRAKRMRYTIEFTRSLYEVSFKRIEGMLKPLGKLQSALGKLTDMASARTILSPIALEAKADPKSVKLRITSRLTTIAGDQERQKSNELKKAAKAFEKLKNLKPFWT
jgi:CHAD domain-containing protein